VEVILKQLEQKSRTIAQMLGDYEVWDNYDIEMLQDGRMKGGKDKWVSVEVVTALLVKFVQEQELSGYLSSPREGVDLSEKVLVSRKQLEEITAFMVLGQPAIFPYIETDFDKGYSKGYYDAKEQIEEKLKELLEGSKEPLNLALAFADVKMKKKGSGGAE